MSAPKKYSPEYNANIVARQLRNLPSRVPALLLIQFTTADFLKLDYVERTRDYDEYFKAYAEITARILPSPLERSSDQ